MSTAQEYLVAVAYFVLFLSGVLGVAIWLKKRRRDRPPVEFRLLRGPGESLRRRLVRFDEDFMFRIGGWALVPFATSLPMWLIIVRLRPENESELKTGLLFTGLAFLVGLFFGGKWALHDLFRYRNDRLGYLGEREVAEHLSAVLAKGLS